MTVVRFGTFEAQLATAELFKDGRRVRLQHQPFEVLRALLEQPGRLVTRDELRQRLWPDGTTVEFDQGMNKCVTKLRDALGDSAANPRFVETLPKRGYRFIAPAVVAQTPPQAGTDLVPIRSMRPRPWMLRLPIAIALACSLFVFGSFATGGRRGAIEARGERTATRAAAAPSPIFAARDAYDRGRVALSRRTPESLTRSVEHFTRAVALSPRFAAGYVGLADAWSLMSSYGLVDPREGMPRARDAANRALTFDPSLARAHASLGRTAMIFDWDWVTAQAHFTRALALDPGDSTTHQWYAYFLGAQGRHDDAVAEAKRAIAADPLSLNANTALGFVLYLARRYDEAADQLERTLSLDPEFAQARRDLALVRVQQRRFAEAVVAMRRAAAISDDAPGARAELAWTQALGGDVAAARKTLASLDRLRSTTFVSPDAVALIYSALDDQDEAVAWLQRAVTMRVAWAAHLPVDPMWDPLRDHPRVREMIAAIRPN